MGTRVVVTCSSCGRELPLLPAFCGEPTRAAQLGSLRDAGVVA